MSESFSTRLMKIPGERLSLATARTLLGYEPEDDVGTIPFAG